MKNIVLFAALFFAFGLTTAFAQSAEGTGTIPLRPLNRSRITALQGLMLPPVTADYTRPKAPLSAMEISELNRPATVMVLSTYNFTVSYPQPGNFMVVLLKYEATNFANQGRIVNSGEAKLNYILSQITESPGSYFTPTTTLLTTTFNPASTGSGSFISPDGYIVTNAHVVEIDILAFRAMAAEQILNQIVEDEIGKLINEYQADPDANILKRCINSIYAYYGQYLTLTNEQVSYTVKTGKTIEDPSYILPARLITKGGAIPKKDVAILKVQGSNFPVVAFGDDRSLKPGNKLYVMGYPGAIEQNEILKTNKMKEPSFTEGMMNARQETSEGWTAIQLDAATYKGNSGGPVFNEYGEVVGLLTFGSPNENNTDLVQGFNFIVPSHVVGEFVRSASVNPRLGVAMQSYREALAIRNESPEKAYELMELVRQYNSDWPYLNSASSVAYSLGKPQTWYEIFWQNFKSRWYTYTGLILGIVYLLYWIFTKIFK